MNPRITLVLYLPFVMVMFSSCDDSKVGRRNPYLQEVDFSLTINTALPLYNALNTVGGSIYVNNGGIRGILIVNKGTDEYLAWEASCPNHAPNSCSTMTLKGSGCVCGCENYTYSLFTGSLTSVPPANAKNIQGLLFYKTTVHNGIITVSN